MMSLAVSVLLVSSFAFVFFADAGQSETDEGTLGAGTIYISEAWELQKIALNTTEFPLSGDYVLANDIDLSAIENFIPIGVRGPLHTIHDGYNFTGTFDGAGYTISNLNIDMAGEDSNIYCGLFGYVYGAVIKDLKVSGNVSGSVRVTAEEFHAEVGGIAGLAYESTIMNCSFSGIVEASGNVFAQTGGIVGAAWDAEITGCSFSGTVNASALEAEAGGIVGYADTFVFTGTSITDCYNVGTVAATGTSAAAGGIVGNMFISNITNCYNTGYVKAVSEGRWAGAGGIAGMLADESQIDQCFNSGPVEAEGKWSEAGGIAGSALCYYYEGDDFYGYPVSIGNCYNTGSVKATFSGPESPSVGGIVGYAAGADIYCCYNIGSLTADGGNIGGIIGYAGIDSDDVVFVDACFFLEGTAADIIGHDEFDGDGLDSISGAYGEEDMKPGSDAGEMLVAAKNGPSIYHSGEWTFGDVEGWWTFIERSNNGYPVLTSVPHVDPIEDTGGDIEDGTEDNGSNIGAFGMVLIAAVALLLVCLAAVFFGKKP